MQTDSETRIAFSMKTLIACLALASLHFVSLPARGQIVLSIDVNERGQDPGTSTFPGFDPFIIDSIVSGTAIQSNATARTFGALTVTLAGVGAGNGYDDRLRTTPVDGGAFTQGLLLRDFVFSRDTNSGGLDITIEGLLAEQFYKVTIWSFDSGSNPNRVSDWFANGVQVQDNYTFTGSALPTSDLQYQFSFQAAASPSGQLAIQGRRDPSSAAATFAVFLNALRLEIGTPDPAVIVSEPQSQELFDGDNAVFIAQAGGTVPISFQWHLNEAPIEDATNSILVVPAATMGQAGNYTLVVANATGGDTSQVATLTVHPVANLASGLVAHWPLDILGFSTPDVTTNMNDLFQENMDALSLEEGRYVSALRFNGINQYLARTNNATIGLPLYGSPGYSVAMWVNGIGTGQNDRRVWSESADTNNSPLMNIGTHSAGTDGSVDIFIRGNSGGTPVNHRRTSLIAFDGSWHHIVWVDNNGFGRVYVDGVPDTNDFNYARVPLQGNIISLGAVVRTNVVAQYSGLIDDVRAWRRSLSEDEVRLVMNQIRVLSMERSGGNLLLTFLTANAAATHRIEERNDVASGAWSEVSGVNFSTPGGNLVIATFPVPVGDQRFYRVGF